MTFTWKTSITISFKGKYVMLLLSFIIKSIKYKKGFITETVSTVLHKENVQFFVEAVGNSYFYKRTNDVERNKIQNVQ